MDRYTAPSHPARLLRVDASARHDGSISRRLGDALVATLTSRYPGLTVTHRDLGAKAVPFIDAAWVEANFTPGEQRNAQQQDALACSDHLVQELRDADLLVFGVPIYNFGIPAVLKAWIDLVARARLTFRYTEQGVEGLLQGKRAYLLVTSGGVAVGSEVDFATRYLKQALNFLGIRDIEIIAADRLNQVGEGAIDQALDRIIHLHETGRNMPSRAAV